MVIEYFSFKINKAFAVSAHHPLSKTIKLLSNSVIDSAAFLLPHFFILGYPSIDLDGLSRRLN